MKRQLITAFILGLTLVLNPKITQAQVQEVYSLNNLKIMIQDSATYRSVLLGNINIPAIESGLVSRSAIKGNILRYPIKIAIDPGHVANTYKEAVLEERFIKSKSEEIDFYEAELTQATSYLLKEMLERHGFKVMQTRENYGTSFGVTYTQWYKSQRMDKLSSDLNSGRISKSQYEQYIKMDAKDLFNAYFNLLDLENRKNKINLFNPDITLVIHFNASEFQARPGIDPPIVDHNYSVAFIPGGFTNNELASSTQSEDLRRLTATDDITKSMLLSYELIKQFDTAFGVKPLPADESGIPWVSKYSSASEYEGIYGRNLFLTRTIESPVAYVEPFLQNNSDFIYKLNERSLSVFGRKTSPVLQTVARCYFNGLLEYLRKGEFSIEF